MQVAPELKIESLFPQLFATALNRADEEYLAMIQFAVDKLNQANLETISALFRAAQATRMQLDDNNDTALLKAAVAATGTFNREYNDVVARQKLNELLQDPDRVANLIRLISKTDNTLSAEEKNRAAGELLELSERYQTFGSMACLDQPALAKTSRMLETMIEYSKYQIQYNAELSASFKEDLQAYIAKLEIYREFMSNRMAYFIETHQTQLRRSEVNIGFGDACRHWQLLEEENKQTLPERFDSIMQPFYKKPLHVGGCEAFTQDLQQEQLPADPFGGSVAADNINDYFLLYIEKHGSRDAKLRMLGCGACFSDNYQANSWAAWMQWGMIYFVQVCGTVKKSVVAIPEAVKVVALSPVAMVAQQLKPVRSAEEISEDLRFDKNRKIVRRLRDMVRSAHRYMRPNPEECIYDVGEYFSNARALLRKIYEAPNYHKSDEYANLSKFALMRLFNLIFEKMIDYLGTPRQQVFMQILSDSVLNSIPPSELPLRMTDEFDGDPILQQYYDRNDRITSADDAIMSAILLCVKFKDSHSHSHYPEVHTNLRGAFYALSSQMRHLFRANNSDQEVIDGLAKLMVEFGKNFQGEIFDEVDAFLRDRLSYTATLRFEPQQDYRKIFEDYKDSYQRYMQLCALRKKWLDDVPRMIDKNPLVLRPPYSLFNIFEHELRDDILMAVVKKIMSDKEYIAPQEIAHCIPCANNPTKDDFVQLIKLACLDYAQYTQARNFKRTSSSRSEQLIKLLVKVSNLEIHLYRLASQDEELIRINKIDKLQALFNTLFYFKKALDREAILPSRLSEKLNHPMILIDKEIADLRIDEFVIL